MKLLRARVQNYKSIDDSGWVDLDQVTCLVGKNESGKTAWVQALCKLNPVPGQPAKFDYELEYPRKRLQPYKKAHADDPAAVVEAEFELTAGEGVAVDEQFGEGALTGNKVTLSKGYDNHTSWTIPYDQQVIVRHLVAQAELPAATAKELAELPRIWDLSQKLIAMGAEPPQAAELLTVIDGWRDSSIGKAIIDLLQPDVPHFFYFDDYSTMKGRIAIGALKQRRDNDQLTEADRTFLALLDLVGADLEEFETPRQSRASDRLTGGGWQHHQRRDVRVLEPEQEPQGRVPPQRPRPRCGRG